MRVSERADVIRYNAIQKKQDAIYEPQRGKDVVPMNEIRKKHRASLGYVIFENNRQKNP